MLWSYREMGEYGRPQPALPTNVIAREAPLAQEIRIEFTRFSAFYSPLIATFAGGFLQQEGLTPKHSVSAPGKSAIAGLGRPVGKPARGGGSACWGRGNRV